MEPQQTPTPPATPWPAAPNVSVTPSTGDTPPVMTNPTSLPHEPRWQRIGSILVVLIVIGFVAFTVFHLIQNSKNSGLYKINGNPSFMASLKQYEAAVNTINLPNQIVTVEENVNPAQSGVVNAPKTCEVVTNTTFSSVTTTKQTCNVSYGRYFGSDSTNKLSLVQSIDTAITKAGWQYYFPFQTKFGWQYNYPYQTEAQAIQAVVAGNSQTDYGLNYEKGSYKLLTANLIDVSQYGSEPAATCNLDPACNAILHPNSHKFAVYFSIGGDFKQTY
jgi:hypothetical protein